MMRLQPRFHGLLLGVAFFLVGGNASAEQPPHKPPQNVPNYSLKLRGSFRGAPDHEMVPLLRSAADELLQYFPDKKFKPIQVQNWKGAPGIFFERNLDGSTRIYVLRITGEGRFWSKYIYEFAHELCHMLHNADLGEATDALWFAESLAELSSLYTLRACAKTWAMRPPFLNQQHFAPFHRHYADERMKNASVPAGMTFLEWFEKQKPDLDGRPLDRPRNRIIAVELLPLFEAEPDRWETMQWLFLRPAERQGKRDFRGVLEDWKTHCPDRHKPFVDQVAEKFGIELTEGDKES